MKPLSLFLSINLVFYFPFVPFPESFNLDQISLIRQYDFHQEAFQIFDNQLSFSPSLQKQITPEITQAKQELSDLSQKFSLNFTEEIGIIYLHQGRQDWLIKFTYGGLTLNTPDDIILQTPQLFPLKQAFENTPFIDIEGISYPTTQFMRQVGPILHQQSQENYEL